MYLRDTCEYILSICFSTLSDFHFAVQLRVRGVDHQSHPIMQELDRVKLYMKKMISIKQGKTEGFDDSSGRPRVDAEVAERIVRFYTENNARKGNYEKARTEDNQTRRKRKVGDLMKQENEDGGKSDEESDEVVVLSQLLDSDSSVEEVPSISIGRNQQRTTTTSTTTVSRQRQQGDSQAVATTSESECVCVLTHLVAEGFR